MDENVREQVRTAARKHALINAVKHESDADVGAIMGPLMGEHPEFREYGDEIPRVIAPVIDEINGLDHEEKRARLEAIAPEELTELDADDEEDEHALPALPNADDYDQIRMRCAPNPNGPWHLGHARMPAVIGSYKQRYDGWFCVRFDDTDPETKRPDPKAYDWILDDIEYLGFEPDAVYRASDRLETYYEHARELIDLGGAYTCSCPAAEFSELKNAGKPCPHRDKAPQTVHEEFDQMVAGEYDSGEMVLRIKTEIEHKNPALRDWVGFRMIDTPHPREEARDYRCWPMLDFQSGIDDHLIGVTHIIRGIDLQDSAKRQQFVYDYFDWEYPEVVHWGHVQIGGYDVPMSTSSIAELIEDGELDGWDDPRAPTLRSLRRRGVRGEAIVESMAQLGTSTSNVDISMSSIYANNRELVDDDADRYFAVRDGVEHAIEGGPDVAEPPRHPNHEDRGTRTIPVDDAVLLEADDVPTDGTRVWLKGYGCVRNEDGTLVWTGDDIDAVREEDVPVVHWVPADENAAVEFRSPDGTTSATAEPEFATTEVDEIIQFVRVGFVRVDSHDDDHVVYYTHD